METAYSSLDLIERYELINDELIIDEINYNSNSYYRNLIDLIGGLGLTNSIHEKFIRSIIYEYENSCPLSNTKRDCLIKKYKAPKNIKKFADDLNLNLEEAFNLGSELLETKYGYITNIDNLFTIISEQRDFRNNYLHGDFDFDDTIKYELYVQHVLDFLELHIYLFKIFRYSFISNIHSLPSLV